MIGFWDQLLHSLLSAVIIVAMVLTIIWIFRKLGG